MSSTSMPLLLLITLACYHNVAGSEETFGEIGDYWSKHGEPLLIKLESAKKAFSDSLTNGLREGLDKALKDANLCEKLNENDHISLFYMFHQIAHSCTSASFNDLTDHKRFDTKLDSIKKSSFDVKSKAEMACLGSRFADLSAWNEKTVCEQDSTHIIESGLNVANRELEIVKSQFDTTKIVSEYQNFIKTCFTKPSLEKWIQSNKNNFANLCAY